MFKFTTLFLTITLCFWFLPLGSFIKPSQEKTACGGKRAFHMCSMMAGKVNPNPSNTVSYQNGSDFARDAKSQASSGNDWFCPDQMILLKEESAPFWVLSPHFAPQFAGCPLDRPPRDLSYHF